MKSSAALVGIIVLFAGGAFAGDTKYYHPGNCYTLSGSLTRLSNMTLNGGTSDANVICPAVKDGSSIAGGFVQVRDRSSAAVECELRTSNIVGSVFSGFTSGLKASAGNSTSMQQLNFGPVSAATDSLYYVSCKIPPVNAGSTSALFTYMVDEN